MPQNLETIAAQIYPDFEKDTITKEKFLNLFEYNVSPNENTITGKFSVCVKRYSKELPQKVGDNFTWKVAPVQNPDQNDPDRKYKLCLEVVN